MQCKVVFHPSGSEVAVEAGTKISEAARLAGVEIATPCGGIGRCGRCTVLIDGDFEDRVLACMTQIDRDMDDLGISTHKAMLQLQYSF